MVVYFGSFAFMLLVSAICLGLAVGGLWLVRHFVDRKDLMNHHDVAGFLLTIIGTLYAVVLGLIVVGALNKFQQARVTVEHEANSLHDIFHLADGLPEKVRSELKDRCRDYANTVMNEEWKAMEIGEHSQKAHLIMQDFWRSITQFRPANAGEEGVHAALLDELDELDDNRHTRLLDAELIYDPFLWGALFAGGAVLVIFTYFFGVEKFAFQALMTALVTFVLLINLMLVALFSSPYSGDVRVPPNAFKSAVRHFNQDSPKRQP